MKALSATLLGLLLFLAGCGSIHPGSGTGGVPPTLPELKYLVIAQAGTPSYCGPPLAVEGWDQQQAAGQFATIRADQPTYLAISGHLNLAHDNANPSADWQLAVWREWKKLQAVRLTPAGDGYDFSVNTGKESVSGHVTGAGAVTIKSRLPGRLNCPICLAAATLVGTPAGAVRVTDLRLGSPVWTAAADGSRVAGIVVRLGSVPFPLGHDAVRVTLSDARSVTASAGHPTADGRTLGSLRPGDPLDGAVVVSATVVHLLDGATYDLLPSGPTGAYWADGILLGSTLK